MNEEGKISQCSRAKKLLETKQSQNLLLQLMETHQGGLFVVYCAQMLAEGPARARQMVLIAA